MAIQMRRGVYTNFNPAKMVAGELAVVQDNDPNSASGRALYVCFEPGVVKRICDYEDIQDLVTDVAEGYISDFSTAVTNANNAASSANSAAAAATSAAQRAEAVASEDIATKTVTFTEASTRANIASTESVATLFGKIKKWFTDLGTAAFRSVANNLTTAASGTAVLDAYQGKLLGGDLATVQSSASASRAYSVGEYLVYNGLLYRVTQAISSGGTLTVGTNITQTTVGSEVSALNSNLPAKMLHGTVSGNLSAGETYKTFTVSFGETLSSTPEVYISLSSGTTTQALVPVAIVSSRSTTGINIRVWRQVGAPTTDAITVNIFWMAIL